jgi:hypothetical protein
VVKGKEIFGGEGMKSRVLVLAVMFLLLSGTLANARSLSSWGPTGIAEIPTADVLDFGVGLAPSLGFYSYTESGSSYTSSLLRVPVTVGLGLGFEFGVTQVSLSTDEPGVSEASGLLIHAKANLVPERAVVPGVSIGGIFDPSSVLGPSSFYLVASKGIGNLKGHIGIGNGIYGVGDQFSIFGGLDFQLTDKTDLIGFYKSESLGLALSVDILPILNATVTYHEGIVLQLGVSIGL